MRRARCRPRRGSQLLLASFFLVAATMATLVPAMARADSEAPATGYSWTPSLSPRGPVTILVSLPEQRAHVYRNGIRIGVAKVSTGKPGHETPTGVFTILQKRREHYSNLYDNAPMPFMQRLTWGGVALHAGHVADEPASHGCIRLPHAFAEALFSVTSSGTTVVVSASSRPPTITTTGVLADAIPGAEALGSQGPAWEEAYRWTPELSPGGPVSIVLSTRDQQVRVLRDAVEIGRAPVAVADGILTGTRVYLLLDGTDDGVGAVPDRPPLRWLEVPFGGEPVLPARSLRAMVAAGLLDVDPDFARQVHDALVPGTSLVVTDEPLLPLVADRRAILGAEGVAAPVTPAARP